MIEEEYNISEVARLTLSSSYISSNKPGTNFFPYSVIKEGEIGTIGKYRTEYYFRNINLKEVLGDLYEKYDFFNLELTSIFLIPVGGLAVLNGNVQREYRVLNVWIEGLDWVNSSHLVKSGNNRSKAHLCCLSNNNGHFISANGTQTYFNNYELTNLKFRKTSQYVNIKINYGSLNDEYNEYIPDLNLPNKDYVFPHSAFTFNITPA